MEICRGSGVRATVRWGAMPLFANAQELAAAGHVTGAERNWKRYGDLVDLTMYGPIEQALLTDPQTSGGLLVACTRRRREVLEIFRAEGFASATVIGEIESGLPGISVV